MRSSAKITLTLGSPPSSDVPDQNQQDVSVDGEEFSWTCGVCGFVNPLPESERAAREGSKCGLCGVGHDPTRSRTTSIPTSRSSTPTITPTHPANGAESIPCPACTFLNHPSLSVCEICSTALPGRQQTISQPQPGRDVSVGKTDIVRFSFRMGGEKEAYRRLKNVLSDKGWERKVGTRRSFAYVKTEHVNRMQRAGKRS
jgi:ESCRT-II complex subunit VPS36